MKFGEPVECGSEKSYLNFRSNPEHILRISPF